MEYSLFTSAVGDAPSTTTSEEEILERKKRRVKRVKEEPQPEINFENVPGVIRMNIDSTAQLLLQCVVGTDITDEYCWKYVPTHEVLENIKQYEFFQYRDQIIDDYKGNEILMIYIPNSSDDSDEFYLCITDEAEKEISVILNTRQAKQAEVLNNCVEKSSRPWKTRGSEKEVSRMAEKSNRPLLLVEVESSYPIKSKQCKFRFRYVENARDGYAEIISARTTFHNVWKTCVDAVVQVKPSSKCSEAQTSYTFPKHAYSQYEYGGYTIELDEVGVKNLGKFIQDKINRICDVVYVNSFINFYNNDYYGLVQDLRYTVVPEVTSIKEYMSLVDTSLKTGVSISNISWHPMWTGTVAISYSDESNSYRKAKPNEDEVNKAIYATNPVLIWSFKDGLFPKLYLETYRDVSVVSFCPYNENLLIAGCINGQIVMWDITNRLQQVEAEEYLTDKQQKYRKLMFSMVNWMKMTRNIQVIRPTAVSNLEFSHRSPVSAIKWFSPHREMTKTGKIREIQPEENRYCLSFMSASRDGTILNWDLNLSAACNIFKRPRAFKRLKKRPPALAVHTSPYKALDKLLKPLFKIIVLEPGTTRPLPICSISLRNTMPKYVEVNPNPDRKFDITDRIIYKPIFNEAKHPIIGQVVIGTSEGDFLIANWSGFDTNSGEIVNKECAIVDSFSKFHDGPIVCVQRTELFPDMCLTVGGKVFAIWKDALRGKPVFWKRSRYRYTHGAWNHNRPSMFRLTRSDGCIELWHLKTRTDRYQDLRIISATGLSGTFTHSLPMKQNIMGIADDNGALRLFYVSQNLADVSEEDKNSTNKLCEREVIRKQTLMKWQQDWCTRNADLLREKYEEKLLEQQHKEEELLEEKARLQKEKERLEREAALLRADSKPEPGRYKEWAQAQLLAKERERINKILLQKKALDLDVLAKQQIPIMKMLRDESQKKEKQKKRLKNAETIFEDTLGMVFPSSLAKKQVPPPDPYISHDSVEIKKNIMNQYSKIELENDKFVKENPHTYMFSWQAVLNDGKDRRKFLDGYYSRCNHKQRIQREKKKRAKIPIPVPVPIPSEVSLNSEDSASLDLA